MEEERLSLEEVGEERLGLEEVEEERLGLGVVVGGCWMMMKVVAGEVGCFQSPGEKEKIQPSNILYDVDECKLVRG